jgi:hypothetical protein
MLDDAKDNYVLTLDEYESYAVSCYGHLKLPYEA